MVRLLFLSVFAIVAGGVQAQTYKCIAAGGKTSYSQSPCPPGAKSAAITQTVPSAPIAAPVAAGDPAGKAAAGPKTAAELELEFRKRRQAKEDADKKESQKLADAQAREENCRNSRHHLENLESGMRQARMNEKGERYLLDEAQIDQEKAKARKVTEQWCK